jgi:mRNA-degrading endonuclease YafQ of YafQ-DinJ toxin-antitoxin module
MKLALTERFQRDVRDLATDRKAALFDVMLSLPRAIGEPHLHSGLGIRKIHRSGIWEARAGLGLRLVFTLERDLLTLVRVGSHDEIRTYLREI